jgi:hypothetical protein
MKKIEIDSMNWKRKLKRILVTGVIVSIVLTLTSCCNQKYVPQETIKIVPTHSIDTCFVVKSDTVLCFETDTLRVEAIIRGTLFKFRVETKPIIVRDTITTKIEQEKAKKEEEKAKKKEEKAKKKEEKAKTFLAFFMCFILLFFLLKIKKK